MYDIGRNVTTGYHVWYDILPEVLVPVPDTTVPDTSMSMRSIHSVHPEHCERATVAVVLYHFSRNNTLVRTTTTGRVVFPKSLTG